MGRTTSTFLWDYFQKIDLEFKIAQCSSCYKRLSYKGTTGNLRSHLKNQHQHIFKELSAKETITTTSTRISKYIETTWKRLSKNKCWRYFTKLDSGDDGRKLAVCNNCKKVLSYRTTVTNLKVHLSKCNPEQLERLLENLGPESDADETILHEDIINDDNSNDSTANSPSEYFEQETGGRARCVLCQATCSNSDEEMKIHLQDHHPKLMGEVVEEEVGSDSENPISTHDDDNAFTEVIYLKDDNKHKSIKINKLSRDYQSKVTQKRPHETPKLSKKHVEYRKRKSSSSSDDVPIKRVKDHSDQELESFITYIKCLLKQVPRHVFSKLQMDIVNLIMNAKLNNSFTAHESSVVVDNVPISLPTMGGINTGYVMTVTKDGNVSVDKNPNVSNTVISVSELPVTNTSTIKDSTEHSYSYTEPNTSDDTKDK